MRGHPEIAYPPDTMREINKAIKQGWKLDRDGWWHRRHRKGDKPIGEGMSHLGFDMLYKPNGHVYVRYARQALEYDRGIQRPWRKLEIGAN